MAEKVDSRTKIFLGLFSSFGAEKFFYFFFDLGRQNWYPVTAFKENQWRQNKKMLTLNLQFWLLVFLLIFKCSLQDSNVSGFTGFLHRCLELIIFGLAIFQGFFFRDFAAEMLFCHNQSEKVYCALREGKIESGWSRKVLNQSCASATVCFF